MALSRNRNLRLTFVLALPAIGAGAAILVGNADPKIVIPTAGIALGAMIFGAIRPRWAERAAVVNSETWWMPTWLALPAIFGVIRHERWERAGVRAA